jgi:DUF971 family protein
LVRVAEAGERTQAIRFDYDDAARALLVEWGDGAVQRIPFGQLRRACPCAVCLGEMGRPGRFDVDPDLHHGEDELADINLVGLYGLGATWADGHSTGIYTFEHLRNLGDRAESESARGAGG